MQPMVYCVATRFWTGWLDCVKSWQDHASQSYPVLVIEGMNVVPAYQQCFERTDEPILAMIHDDVVICEDGWDKRVLKEFDDPTVGMVGFAGAKGHGRPEMYTVPFNISNIVRMGFMSNMRTAESHGFRFAGEWDVAVLDGLAMFVRRSILEKVGGWPVDKPYGFWLYAEWLSCETRRQGNRIRLVGVDCDHLGGKTSGSANVTDNFEDAHRYLYENNRDVLPYEVAK